jgi:hypothetical protein
MAFHLRESAIGWTKRKSFVPTMLVASVVLFFAPVVFWNRVFFLKDAQLVVYPVRMALRNRFLAWDLPQWLPELDMGLPLMGDPANGIFYPLNVIFLLPAPWSINLFVVTHLALGMAGAYVLLRSLHLRPSSAAFGALGFTLGGYMVSLTWIANYVMSLGWMPIVAWAALRTLQRRRLRDAALTGLLLGLQVLAGEPQGVVLTGWLVVALALSYPTHWRRRLHGAALLGLSVFIAACIACPLILPTLELLPRSRRAHGIDLVEASHWSLHPLRLIELAVPWIWGNPIRFQDFLGFFMNDEGHPLHRDPWIATPYFGSLGVLLCGVGIATPLGRHRWWVRGLSVLSLLMLFIAFGRHTPVFALYFEAIPGASLFRYPAKFFGLLGATLPFLAAAGLESLRRRRGGLYAFASLGACLLIAMVAAFPMAGAIAERLHALRPAVSIAAALGTVSQALVMGMLLLSVTAGALLVVRRYRPTWVGPGAVVGLATQLLFVNLHAYETADSSIYAPPELAQQMVRDTPPSHLPRVLHKVPSLSLPGIDAWTGTHRGQALGASLMMNTGIPHGIHYARAYVSADEGPKRRMWDEAAGWQRGLIDAFGVRYVILPEDFPLEGASGLERIDRPGELGAAVYRNVHARPFAYPAAVALPVVTQEEALRALSDPSVSRGGVVALEADVPAAHEFAANAGACQLIEAPADTIEIDCRLTQPAWVVINASHHPNWSATVNDEEAEILRANAFVMAVAAPAGPSRIFFEYAEPSLPIGLVISALGFVLVVALGLWRPKPSRGKVVGT